MAAILLLAEFLGRGLNAADLRFVTEAVVITFICAIVAKAVAAIAAMTCIALWK